MNSIGKLKSILNKISLTTVLPVVLVIGGILINLLVLGQTNQQPSSSLGGPLLANLSEAVSYESNSLLADNIFEDEIEVAASAEGTAGFVIIDKDSLLNAS